jgi:hypothetical protein
MLVQCYRQLTLVRRLGRTIVEVAAHPLNAGTDCELFFAQEGSALLSRVRLTLVCLESVSYQEGTDTRNETQTVYEEEIHRQFKVQLGPGARHEARCPLRLPAGAMHSFASAHNKVHWIVRVWVEVPGGPPEGYQRDFPLLVYPEQRQGVA